MLILVILYLTLTFCFYKLNKLIQQNIKFNNSFQESSVSKSKFLMACMWHKNWWCRLLWLLWCLEYPYTLTWKSFSFMLRTTPKLSILPSGLLSDNINLVFGSLTCHLVLMKMMTNCRSIMNYTPILSRITLIHFAQMLHQLWHIEYYSCLKPNVLFFFLISII